VSRLIAKSLSCHLTDARQSDILAVGFGSLEGGCESISYGRHKAASRRSTAICLLSGDVGLESAPNKKQKSRMPVRVTDNGRLFGLDFGDWSLLVVGFTVAGLLVLLV
jgi:hypothetical protein